MYSCKIRDSLHGTLHFSEVERRVMDRSEFQRLRRIGQTSFVRYVFPCATHSRFEHSLGTMHLAGRIFESLLRNQKKLLGSLIGTQEPLEIMQQDPYVLQALRLAALLHDVGHTPFSHSCEGFLPSNRECAAYLERSMLPDWFRVALFERCHAGPHDPVCFEEDHVSHELMTLLLSHRILFDPAEGFEPALARNVLAILDSRIAPEPDSSIKKYGLQPLLHEIISGEVDADRMDYLQRDSRQAGVVYGLFDMDRILDSTAFYVSEKGMCHLALQKSGVPAFEDYLRARLSMYQQVYFHKTSTACQAMLESAHKWLGAAVLPLAPEEYLAIDDSSFLEHACKNSHGKRSGFGRKILEDLILHRKLWKRIYEETIPRSAGHAMPSLCPAVINFLREREIPCELIEDKTTLTRFHPMGRRKRTENALRVIVKDMRGSRSLDPIENHSRLVNRLDEDCIIRRVFVSQYNFDGQAIDFGELQRAVANAVLTPA